MLSVERILTFLFATHTNILTSHKSTEPSSSTSTLWERSPTPYTLRIQPQLRFRTLAPGIFDGTIQTETTIITAGTAVQKGGLTGRM